VDERYNKRSSFTLLRRLELESKDGISHEEWQYLRARVDEVILTCPEAREEEYTDEDEGLDAIDPQLAAGADTGGENDWTTEETR
jgi:hypothetical protein